MICKYCGSFYHIDDAALCPMCGELLLPAREPVMAFSSRNAFAVRSRSVERELFAPAAPSAAPGVDEKSGPPHFESLLAKLDQDERDIFSRFDKEQPAYTPESEAGAAMWDARENNLASLSTALDGMLADMLGTAEAGCVRTPVPETPALPKRARRQTASSFRAALVAAVFLLGMAAGLLVSNLFGL